MTLPAWLRKELAFFRDVPVIAPTPDREISVMLGAGSHLYVQTTHWPDRNRQEQEIETANHLLRAAQILAVSAGAVVVPHGTPAEGVPNG